MFARFGVVAAALAATTVVSGCSGIMDAITGPDDTSRYDGYQTFHEGEVGPDECIAVAEDYVGPWMRDNVPSEEEDWSYIILLGEDAAAEVVPMTGDYAARDERFLLCRTASQVAEQEERQRLQNLLQTGKACYLVKVGIVAYDETEYSHRDRIKTCVSDEEAQADDELADEFIAELDRVPRDGDWTDRANATVTLYCDLKEQWGKRFVLPENAARVNQAFTELYELDRLYTPGYPREFEDAIADWCGIYETDKGEPMPQPEPHSGQPYPPEPNPSSGMEQERDYWSS